MNELELLRKRVAEFERKESESSEELKRQKLEIQEVIRALSDDVFDKMQSELPLDKQRYVLNTETLVCAISDAFTDINRVGTYHSTTGANEFKKAAYIAKRISITKPIQVLPDYPKNLININLLNNIALNAIYSVFIIETLIGKKKLSTQLRQDLQYVFKFRDRMDPDALAMLLEHAAR